ncbi:MAG: UDP-glucose 4-epimerase [Glomeribacter sp. 1016415]|nr:UDP-glucose 4-epimerase [Glomeribacter sp. 1016415]
MNVLVTGANGFIGRAVCRKLLAIGHSVNTLVRRASSEGSPVPELVHEAADFADIESTLLGVAPPQVVIHLAARVHVVRDASSAPLEAFRATNVSGTLRVAQAAARAGAHRFIFMSSVKALGEVEPGRPWREEDLPAPTDPYGISKYEAEKALTVLGRETGMEIVIVRPPLVYGPGVRANFLQLMRAIQRGFPLPLGAVQAQRSFIYIENLADAIAQCVTHAAAANRVFHVSDGIDLSVAQLVLELGRVLDTPARLWRVPLPWLIWLGRLTGQTMQMNRLLQPLRLDITQMRTVLGWSPPYAMEAGLLHTATWYQEPGMAVVE